MSLDWKRVAPLPVCPFVLVRGLQSRYLSYAINFPRGLERSRFQKLVSDIDTGFWLFGDPLSPVDLGEPIIINCLRKIDGCWDRLTRELCSSWALGPLFIITCIHSYVRSYRDRKFARTKTPEKAKKWFEMKFWTDILFHPLKPQNAMLNIDFERILFFIRAYLFLLS